MVADISYTTVNLPPCFIGVPYEASIAYKGAATPMTAQSIVAGTTLTGLPAGLAMDLIANPGSTKIAGTATGAASGGNTPKSGLGNYTFTVSLTDTAGAAVSSTYTITVYQSPQDLVMLGQHGTQDGLN